MKGTAQLCWAVDKATAVTIAPGIGTVKASGCATVSPAQTTTYTLTAVNAVGPSTATATLTVGTGVQILSFTSSPEYSQVAGTKVTLSWQTTGALNVIVTGDIIALPSNGQNPSPGPFPVTNLPATGTLDVFPDTNTDYTLTAYGPGGASVSSVIHVFVR